MNRLLTIIFLVTLVFIMFFHPIYAISQDLGRHILTGEIILQTKSIPNVNLYSYTHPNFPFINHHWFSEVVVYLIQKTTGFMGLLLFTTSIATAAFLIQLIYLRKKAAIIPTIFCSLIYLHILLERTDLRPEIFSFFFLSIFMVILYSYRNRFTRWIFVLPFVELLWVNMHIYFPIGIAIIGFFLFDYLITNRKKLNPQHTIILAGVLLVSLVVTLLNPNGPQGVLYPLQVFQNYGYSIEENQNIFFLWSLFRKSTLFYFFIAAPLLFASLLLAIKKTYPVDWLLAIFFTILSATSERNLLLFVFATFIPLVRSFGFIYGKLLLAIKSNPFLKISTLLLFVIFLIWQSKDIITFKPFGYQIPVGGSKGADFLISNNIKSPIFNNFDIGSYLGYRLYPKEKVFVDGRPEAYPSSFFKNTYIPMQNDGNVFEQVNNKYHFNTIFFSHTDQTPWAKKFLTTIAKNPDWSIVYIDSNVIILLKNGEKNKAFLEAHTISENSFQIPQSLKSDEQSLIHFALLSQNLSWLKLETQAYQHLLTVNPKSCFALFGLSRVLSNNKNPSADIYLSKFNSYCR